MADYQVIRFLKIFQKSPKWLFLVAFGRLKALGARFWSFFKIGKRAIFARRLTVFRHFLNFGKNFAKIGKFCAKVGTGLAILGVKIFTFCASKFATSRLNFKTCDVKAKKCGFGPTESDFFRAKI